MVIRNRPSLRGLLIFLSLLVICGIPAQAFNPADTLPGRVVMVPGLHEGHYIPIRTDTAPGGTIFYQSGRGGGSTIQSVCTPPVLNPVSNKVFCNGNSVASIPFSASDPNALFSWTNSNPAIGLPASGAGALPIFTATNMGTTPVTATITATPSLTTNGDLYITNYQPASVSLLDPATNSIAASIPTITGNFNVGVSISPDNTRAFVTSYLDGYLHVFNTATRTRIASVNLGGAPFGVTAGSQRIFVTDLFLNRFWVIDAATLTVLATISLPTTTQTRAACLNPAETIVYVSSENIIFAYDANTLTLIGTRAIPGNAYGLAVSSDGLRLFYADRDGYYGILNANGLGVIYQTPTPLANGWAAGVCVNRAGTRAYIAHQGSNQLFIHDLTNLTFTSIAMPSGPTGVSLLPDESRLYVANINSNTVTAINTATNGIITNIPVVSNPVSIGDFAVEANGCTGAPISFDITVNPTPSVNSIPNKVLCDGGSASSISFSGPVAGTEFNWTNDTPAIGLPSSGTGDIAAFIAANTGSVPVTATITVTPTFTNGGVSCSGSPQTFTITVNPKPTASLISNQTLCNGATTNAVSFTGPVTGTVYNWVNSDPSIGLAVSGTGPVPSFTAINTGTTPVIATITITPSYTNAGVTCTGSSISYTITVNPTPTVNAVSNRTVCNGSSVAPVSFSSPVAGVVYSWTNDSPSIGLAASGSGDISSFTAINNGTAPIVATISVTPRYTNNGVTCSGAPVSYTITVNPTPTVIPVNDQVICPGNFTTAVLFSSPATGGTVTYSWTNNTPSIGLAASGTGNIFSFRPINTTISPITATITVTPSYTSGGVTCSGPTRSFTITVNAFPNVLAVNDQSVCNGLLTSPVTFSGFVAGTVFNWTNNNTSIGLPASGTADIPPFIGINTGATPVTATITVTPSKANAGVTCTGFSQTFNFVVNPTPTGTLATPTTTFICEGSSVTLTASGGATYQWYLNNGLIPGANGATYAATQPGIYTAVPISAFGCRGNPTNAVILTLIRRPQPDFSFDKYCAGFPTNFTNLSNTNGSGTVAYAWTFGDGGLSIQANPAHVYAQPGTYNVGLSVAPVLCPALLTTVTKPVTIVAPPVNVRYPTVNAVVNRDLQLQGRLFTGAAYQWIPPTGLNNPTTQNPVFNFNQEQQYRIRIVTAEGCVVNDTLLVRMFPEREIYVASGFTPNGDGKNDLIIPKLVGIKTLRYFKVYDRWGQLVYQTNIEGQGWDGRLKGVPQPVETYVWIAEGIDLDDKVVKRSGNFILFR